MNLSKMFLIFCFIITALIFLLSLNCYISGFDSSRYYLNQPVLLDDNRLIDTRQKDGFLDN